MDCNLFKFCLTVNGASLDHGASNFIMCHKKLYDSCTYTLNLLLSWKFQLFFWKWYANLRYSRYILSLLMHFIIWYKITWKTRDKISDDCETNKLYIASKTIKSVDEVHQGNWFLVENYFSVQQKISRSFHRFGRLVFMRQISICLTAPLLRSFSF